MRSNRLCLLISAAALIVVGASAPASATTITWDLSSPTGDLGSSHSYPSGGFTIVASGFADNWTPTDIYGKALGGDESGLGIANDPTGNHEIYTGTWIQIDVSQPLSMNIMNYQFEMGSTTGGEAWTVYGANTTGPGTVLTPLYVNQTDELTPHPLSGFKFYDFAYTGPDNPPTASNVLLYKTFAGTSAIPEPSTLAMMLLGFVGLGVAGYRGRRAATSIA